MGAKAVKAACNAKADQALVAPRLNICYAGRATAIKGPLAGGVFVPVGDWEQLGDRVAQLCADRGRLAQLIRKAGRNGTRFNDVAVYKERSDLIQRHL